MTAISFREDAKYTHCAGETPQEGQGSRENRMASSCRNRCTCSAFFWRDCWNGAPVRTRIAEVAPAIRAILSE